MSKFILLILSILLSVLSIAQTIGGQMFEKAYDMTQDNNGNLILVGYTGSYGAGNKDGFIVKYNPIAKTYQYSTWGKSEYDELRSVSMTEDDIIIGGYSMWRDESSAYQAVLVKLNSELQLEWVSNFGNWHFQHGYTTLVLNNGDYLLGGVDRQITWPSPFLVKTDNSGQLIWEKTWIEYSPSYIVDMLEKENGNIVLLCSVGGFFNLGSHWHSAGSSNADVCFLEIDSSGNVVKLKVIHNPHHDIPVKIIPAFDDKYYLLSHSQGYSNNMSFDICLSLVNSDYTYEWTKTYGGEKFEYAADMEKDSLGNIHIVGTSSSINENFPIIMYLKLNSDGDELETEYLSPDKRGYGSAIELIGNDVFILGTQTTSADDNDFVIYINNVINVKIEDFKNIQVYPNPTTDFCTISLNQTENRIQKYDLEIISVNGSVVLTEKNLASDNNKIIVNLSDLSTGQYIIKIKNKKDNTIITAVVNKI